MNLRKLIPAEHYPERREKPVADCRLQAAVAQGQRLVEGYNSDGRVQLWKYGFIIEQQRRIIHNRRLDVLMDRIPLKLLESKAPERYAGLRSQVGGQVLKTAEKQLVLYYIGKCWAEYLDYIAYC